MQQQVRTNVQTAQQNQLKAYDSAIARQNEALNRVQGGPTDLQRQVQQQARENIVRAQEQQQQALRQAKETQQQVQRIAQQNLEQAQKTQRQVMRQAEQNQRAAQQNAVAALDTTHQIQRQVLETAQTIKPNPHQQPHGDYPDNNGHDRRDDGNRNDGDHRDRGYDDRDHRDYRGNQDYGRVGRRPQTVVLERDVTIINHDVTIINPPAPTIVEVQPAYIYNYEPDVVTYYPEYEPDNSVLLQGRFIIDPEVYEYNPYEQEVDPLIVLHPAGPAAIYTRETTYRPWYGNTLFKRCWLHYGTPYSYHRTVYYGNQYRQWWREYYLPHTWWGGWWLNINLLW